MEQPIFLESVNAIGVAAAIAFFACLIAGGISFLPLYRHARAADLTEPLSVWKNPTVRKSFLSFFAIWLVGILCLAIALTIGGWPTSYE